MTNKMIDNVININLSVNFYAVKFLFDATKIIGKRHNNFISYKFIID